MSYVSYDLVVRNTVMLGGAHAMGNLRQILESWIQRQSIHAPSPLRLLRLVNGRKCERTSCCTRKTNTTRLGLHICATCAKELTTRRSWRERRFQYCESIINDDRVDKTWGTMVLREPFHSNTSKDPVGPLVSYADIEAIMNEGLSLDSFFQQKKYSTADNDVSQRLWQIYDEAGEDKEEVGSQWSDRREGKEKAKVDEVIDAVAQIKSTLKGSAKDYAMEYTVSNDGTQFSLSFGITHELTREIVHAPSKITKKKLRQIAASIDAAYPLAFAHGLHDFSCLSWHDPLQHAIRANLEQSTKYEPGLAFLRDRSFVGAMASLENHKDAISPVLKRVFSWTYYGVVPSALHSIIAKLIVDQTTEDGGDADFQLAESICAGINLSTATAGKCMTSSASSSVPTE
jgi:hypothetical protein